MKTASGAEPVTHRKRMLDIPTAFGLSWSMSPRVVMSTSPALISLPPARLLHPPGLPSPNRAIVHICAARVQSAPLCTECTRARERWLPAAVTELPRPILRLRADNDDPSAKHLPPPARIRRGAPQAARVVDRPGAGRAGLRA